MHLTYEERCQIYALRSNQASLRSIAKQLDRNVSTISREIKRNSGKRGYRFKQAQRKALERRKAVSKKRVAEYQIDMIRSLLRQKWSPEQIVGWHRRQKLPIPSHEWIYQYIWNDKYSDGILYKHLRRRGKKYNKRASLHAGRGVIPNRIDIDKRPEIVNQKERLGDWEADTIIGKDHRGAILTIVERKSQLLLMANLANKTAESTQKAFTCLLQPIKQYVHTITTDNGKEFAHHEEVSRILNVQCFFAKPYHSWERGLNEQVNGLIRQYIPKKFDLSELDDKLVLEIQNSINSRPRKTLGFRSPIEVFNDLALSFSSSVAFQT